MDEVIVSLNKYSNLISLLFSLVVTVATAIYAVLTWRLVSETRQLRQVQTEPRIEITQESFEYAVNIVRLRIRNIGLGPALSLRFSPRVTKGGDVAKSLLEEFTASSYFSSGLHYLGPGQHLFSLYTNMMESGPQKRISTMRSRASSALRPMCMTQTIERKSSNGSNRGVNKP